MWLVGPERASFPAVASLPPLPSASCWYAAVPRAGCIVENACSQLARRASDVGSTQPAMVMLASRNGQRPSRGNASHAALPEGREALGTSAAPEGLGTSLASSGVGFRHGDAVSAGWQHRGHGGGVAGDSSVEGAVHHSLCAPRNASSFTEDGGGGGGGVGPCFLGTLQLLPCTDMGVEDGGADVGQLRPSTSQLLPSAPSVGPFRGGADGNPLAQPGRGPPPWGPGLGRSGQYNTLSGRYNMIGKEYALAGSSVGGMTSSSSSSFLFSPSMAAGPRPARAGSRGQGVSALRAARLPGGPLGTLSLAGNRASHSNRVHTLPPLRAHGSVSAQSLRPGAGGLLLLPFGPPPSRPMHPGRPRPGMPRARRDAWVPAAVGAGDSGRVGASLGGSSSISSTSSSSSATSGGDIHSVDGGSATPSVAAATPLEARPAFLPLALIFFCATFNYTILRDTKDALVITAPGGGVEQIPFLTTYFVLPTSVSCLSSSTGGCASCCHLAPCSTRRCSPSLRSSHSSASCCTPTSRCCTGRTWPTSCLRCSPSPSRGWSPYSATGRSPFFTWSLSCGEASSSPSCSGGWRTMCAPSPRPRRCTPCWESPPTWRSSLQDSSSSASPACASRGGDRLVAHGAAAGHRSGSSRGRHHVLDAPQAAAVRQGGRCSWQAQGGVPPKRRPKISLAESVRILLQSPRLRNLTMVVVGYGISTSLFDVSWKNQLRQLYTSPQAYGSVLAEVSTATGILTICFMLLSRYVFAFFGWGVAAATTPTLMLATGAIFFLLSIAAPASGGLAISTAVAAGSVQQVVAKAAKYSLFDPAKEMVFIPMNREEKTQGKAAVDLVGSQLGKSGGSWITQALLLGFGSLTVSLPILAVLYGVVIVLWLSSAKQLTVLMRQHTEASQGTHPLPQGPAGSPEAAKVKVS
eukprot:jgi/Mesvir1/15471/Mv20012-RA.1